MNVIIVEDEAHLANQLENMLDKVAPDYNVVYKAHSVQTGIEALVDRKDADLIFLDIYLSDGLSFEIFKEVDPCLPVIFTTAYDEYALEAFDLNSIDYLLKPIREEKLRRALDKYERVNDSRSFPDKREIILQLAQNLQGNQYQQNFLLPYKDRLVPLHADDFRYFKVTHNVSKGLTLENRMYIMDESLEELSDRLDPAKFFRANRQFLIHRKSIIDIEPYFNGRLSLNLFPKPQERVLISKARVRAFKNWMNDRF